MTCRLSGLGGVSLTESVSGPVIALGGAGDARMISNVIQVISRVVDHKMSLAEY